MFENDDNPRDTESQNVMISLMHFEKNTRKQQNNDTQQKKITFCPSYTKEK
jgi:hypothetical protein